MTDTCKVCLKTVKRSDNAILCDHFDNWIYIKCDNFDKRDYEMFKVQRTHGSVEKLEKQLSHL